MLNRLIIAAAVASTLACSSSHQDSTTPPAPTPARNDVAGHWKQTTVTCNTLGAITTNEAITLDLTATSGVAAISDGSCTATVSNIHVVDGGDHASFNYTKDVTCNPSPTCKMTFVVSAQDASVSESNTCPNIDTATTILLTRVDAHTMSMQPSNNTAGCTFTLTGP